MGSAYSWVAMKDVSADQICQKLGLVRCGGEFDFPEAEFSGATLPTGWYVVVADVFALDFLDNFRPEELSESHDVMVMQVEEHVMRFDLAFWRAGKCLWSVLHGGDGGVYNLEAEGKLPADFEALRAEYIKRQEEAGGENARVDYLCEVPLELGRLVTGFCYNMRYDEGEEPVFEELDVSDYAPETFLAEKHGGGREEAEAQSPGQQPPQPGAGNAPPSRLERWLLKFFDVYKS